MINILNTQNSFVNFVFFKKNKIIFKKTKKKFKYFFLKLKLNKGIIKKTEYREIINNKKLNFMVYKKNRIKYLKRRLNAKKNIKY